RAGHPAGFHADEKAMLAPEERLYQQAKQAIQARDYGGAPELLQLAKQQNPTGGRGVNPLRGVHDKLGRFRPGSRVDQLALAAEPNSPAVLANMQYSQKLQSIREEQTLQAAVEAPAITVAAVTQPQPQALQPGPVLLGRYISIVNASGDPAAGKR